MRLFLAVCLLCAHNIYGLQNKYVPRQPSKRNIITIAVAATNPNTPRSPRTNQNSRNRNLPSPIHDFTHIPFEYHENLHDLIPENKHATPPTKTRSIITTKTSFSHKAYLSKKHEDKKSSSCCCTIQ